jgi:hypothetical protein
MATTAFTYTPQSRPRAAVGYHPRRSPMRLLLPRWAIGEPAGRWISLQPFLVDGPTPHAVVAFPQEPGVKHAVSATSSRCRGLPVQSRS